MNKPRIKMPVSERAKQFMPFAALKGLPEALAEKERIVVPKVEMSEDMATELDRKMNMIKCGEVITVTYYSQTEYIRMTGMIARCDYDSGILQIVETKICFKDIMDIQFNDEK